MEISKKTAKLNQNFRKWSRCPSVTAPKTDTLDSFFIKTKVKENSNFDPKLLANRRLEKT